MRRITLPVALILFVLSPATASAQLPAQIGSAFLLLNSQGHYANTEQLLFLASGGVTQLLLDGTSEIGHPYTYAPSVAGGFTYSQAADSPDTANLDLTLTAVPPPNLARLQYFGVGADGSYDILNISQSNSAGLNNGYALFLPSADVSLFNGSNRVVLHAADTAVTGFVVQGSNSRLVLIRVVGNGLAQFGVSPVAANPTLNLFSGASLIATGHSWDSYPGYDNQAMGWIFGIAGAFALEVGSKDQVYFNLLAPGAYTVQASDTTVGSSGGNALIEVYVLPFTTQQPGNFKIL
jgi:hypothetical protein